LFFLLLLFCSIEFLHLFCSFQVLKLGLPSSTLKSSSEAVLCNLFHLWFMIMVVIKKLWILFLFHFVFVLFNCFNFSCFFFVMLWTNLACFKSFMKLDIWMSINSGDCNNLIFLPFSLLAGSETFFFCRKIFALPM
jgi:hypothetical protein